MLWHIFDIKLIVLLLYLRSCFLTQHNGLVYAFVGPMVAILLVGMAVVLVVVVVIVAAAVVVVVLLLDDRYQWFV